MIDKDYLACSGLKNSKIKPEDRRSILRVIKKHPFMNSYQVKIKLGRPVEHLSARTIRRIILDSGRPACVSSRVLALTEEMRCGRVNWCKRMMRRRASFWKDTVFVDEVYFCTKASTGGRLVRRPRGTPRNHSKYTRKVWKKPEKLLALCGISGDGHRYLHFLKKGKRMNSNSFVSLLKKEPSTFSRVLMMDRSRVHTSKMTRAFLEAGSVRTLLLPPRSPDLHPIENLFGYLKAKLLQHPTKTLQQLRRQVRKCFFDLPDHYMAELASSMRRRMRQVIYFEGEATKY